MKTLTIPFILALVTLFSCNSTSQAVKSDAIETTSETSVNTEKPEIIYDAIISFTSRASGIDNDIKNKIDKILADFNAENDKKLEPEIVPWGREGEVDYHFITKNLSTAQKKNIAAQIKEAIGSSETVFIMYNKKSVHKR
jgi:hypothetical protein